MRPRLSLCSTGGSVMSGVGLADGMGGAISAGGDDGKGGGIVGCGIRVTEESGSMNAGLIRSTAMVSVLPLMSTVMVLSVRWRTRNGPVYGACIGVRTPPVFTNT